MSRGASLDVLAVGNGGMVNRGLPHNAVLLNGEFLLDCPHDIVRSFQTLGLATTDVNTVFISHFHADHTFGFPMFVLDRWMSGRGATTDLVVYGPTGVGRRLTNLVRWGLLADHPAYRWMLEHVRFVEVGVRRPLVYRDLRVTPVALKHVSPTLGLVFSAPDERPVFAYLTDTSWCPSVARVLGQGPQLAWIDLNGGPSGLHLAYDELVERGLPLAGGRTRFWGTHLGEFRPSRHAEIHMVSQGDRAELAYGRG